MRQIVITAAAAFLIGGISTGALLSQAQPAPPSPDAAMADPPPHPGMPGWGMPGDGMPGQLMPGRGMREWRHSFAHERPFNPRDLALIHRQPDRQLVPADVQKIVEAFLLWNGNHRWKVADVLATQDGPIGFSLTTAEGSVIAKFTMDPHTGGIVRVG